VRQWLKSGTKHNMRHNLKHNVKYGRQRSQIVVSAGVEQSLKDVLRRAVEGQRLFVVGRDRSEGLRARIQSNVSGRGSGSGGVNIAWAVSPSRDRGPGRRPIHRVRHADSNAARSPKQLIEQFRKCWISFQFPVHRIDNPLEVRVVHQFPTELAEEHLFEEHTAQ